MPAIRAATTPFHETADTSLTGPGFIEFVTTQDTQFTYAFENFFHPFVGELIDRLNRKSLAGLLDPNFHQTLTDSGFFDKFYAELATDLVKINHLPKEIDLREGGPYSVYNWELLFHAPLTIAVHLSKNQRFAEAQRWFHYIFDPTSRDTSQPVPQRFWKFLAFRKAGGAKQIDEQLAILSKPADECTPAELDLKREVLQGYENIKNKPFQPHAVARARQVAYQYSVLMKYLDNLIAWGDSLFRQDTIESINEATQLYVLAANLLGERPQRIPQPGNARPMTYAELKKQKLDAMGNALVGLEGQFPLTLGTPQVHGDDPDAAGPLFGIGHTLYFCVPRNDKLLGYWDSVADRLFKIRNCMNIEGVARQLQLFDPPLDPGLFVQAAAAGIDIGAIISGLNQPVSPVRAQFLIQKALELCGEVRSLGAALLSVIEKGDSERLASLRQGHEIKVQQMQQEVRFLQWASAQETTKSLLTNRKAVFERHQYYRRLLGLPPDPNAPDDLALDFAKIELNEKNFALSYGALVDQYDKQLAIQAPPGLLNIVGGSSPAILAGATASGQLYLSQNEDSELNTHLPAARAAVNQAAGFNILSTVYSLFPDVTVNGTPIGVGGTGVIPVGTGLSRIAKIAADVQGLTAERERDNAGMASRTASYERRADEWTHQYNLAARELMQIGRQILTALIAEQIAHHDYLTTKQQIAHAQQVQDFLRKKFTNDELYAWMQGENSRLYYEYYRFAFDTARKAEQAMKRELMRPEVDAQDFVKFNYWDGGREGLLSGEALYLDVKRMELAYHENNKREYELTRHISLRQLNPKALLQLKTTGTCPVTIPEWVLDLDTPGHYMRRIKGVGITIPCVTGPYTSLSCTLTLTKSSVRISPIVGQGYARQGSEDGRFVDYLGATRSIVTSTGQNDSGLFEASPGDERLQPFEGAGVVDSHWTLELPKPFRQFDYSTISDAILHFRYTAREGGDPMAKEAARSLDQLAADAIKSLGQEGTDETSLGLLLSLKHDFPTEWAAYVKELSDFTLSKDHFPYLAQNSQITITRLELYNLTGTSNPERHDIGDKAMWEAAASKLNQEGSWTLPGQALPHPANTDPANTNPWLVVRYVLATKL
ncbi:hypothetical protein ACFV4T_18945 [Streptomyces sp. NPDC059755]|uniref:Tc toxin subunit A-related protein n=1 Tax=Streptomyces sp. NPDC059755 TaxID=3346934 RepID=UPI0036472B82